MLSPFWKIPSVPSRLCCSIQRFWVAAHAIAGHAKIMSHSLLLNLHLGKHSEEIASVHLYFTHHA